MTEVGHGQLWWADLEGDKIRPVLVLTRSWIAPKLARVLVAPITTTVRNIPCEVALDASDGVPKHCVANLDNIGLIESERLLEHIGNIPPNRWPEVCAAMAHVIAC